MASSTAEIKMRFTGSKRLKELDRDLREAAREGLRNELRKGLVRAANPCIRDLRAAVRAVQVTAVKPSPSPRKYPQRRLRATIARALVLSYKTRGDAFVRIEVGRNRLPEKEWNLPKYLDGTVKPYDRWRFPIFQKEWEAGRVAQNRGQPWFFITIDKHRRNMRTEMFRAMARTAQKIGGL